MTEAELQAIRDENEQLKARNKALEEQTQANLDAQAEAKVDAAIAAKKLHPDQKESALKMCKADPEGFDTFVGAAKPMVNQPENNMFDNKGGNNHSGNDTYIDPSKF